MFNTDTFLLQIFPISACLNSWMQSPGYRGLALLKDIGDFMSQSPKSHTHTGFRKTPNKSEARVQQGAQGSGQSASASGDPSPHQCTGQTAPRAPSAESWGPQSPTCKGAHTSRDVNSLLGFPSSLSECPQREHQR